MSTPTRTRPASTEYHPFYKDYIDLVPDGDVLEALEEQLARTLGLLEGVEDVRADQSYAAGKWTLKELVGHLVDTERVFAYRALSIARDDPAPLPGMDQDDWVRAADTGERSFDDVREEYRFVRLGNLHLFRGFSPAAWERAGTANESPFLVRVVPWILAGHERHHQRILEERYL